MTCKLGRVTSCLLLAASDALRCPPAYSAEEDPWTASDVPPGSCLSCNVEAWS